MATTAVKYFIPDDGDDQGHPNVFFINTPQPTLGALRKDFPVPGVYHFRFLRTIGELKVWMDVVDENAPVPTTDGQIFAKVSRVHAPMVVQASRTPQVHVESTTKIGSVPQNDNNGAVSSGVQDKKSTSTRNTSNLINFSEEAESVPVPPPKSPAPDASNDLLGFDMPMSSKPASNVDLFGLETLQPTAPGMGGSSGMKLQQPNPTSAMSGSRPMGVSSSPGGPMNGSGFNNPMGGGGGGFGSSAPMMGGINQNARASPMGQYDAFSGLGTSGAGRGNQFGNNRGPMGQQQQQRR